MGKGTTPGRCEARCRNSGRMARGRTSGRRPKALGLILQTSSVSAGSAKGVSGPRREAKNLPVDEETVNSIPVVTLNVQEDLFGPSNCNVHRYPNRPTKIPFAMRRPAGKIIVDRIEPTTAGSLGPGLTMPAGGLIGRPPKIRFDRHAAALLKSMTMASRDRSSPCSLGPAGGLLW